MERESKIGGLYALAAFGFWGAVTPIYFKSVAHLPASEVLAHRIVWSLVLVGCLLMWGGDWKQIRATFRSRRTVLMLLLSTTLISINWLAYIWSISSEQAMQASLGYYINPLVNVLLGTVFLREKLSRAQALAVLLAALGVANLTWHLGVPPWLGLAMAFSFGFYGLIRKTIPAGSQEGLFMETAILTPVAVVFLGGMALAGEAEFAKADMDSHLLLALSGPATALPLIWFTNAAKRLRYTTIGFFQYLAPTGIFLIAVFVFDEPFTTAHLVTFALIWTALAIFTTDNLMRGRRVPGMRQSPKSYS